MPNTQLGFTWWPGVVAYHTSVCLWVISERQSCLPEVTQPEPEPTKHGNSVLAKLLPLILWGFWLTWVRGHQQTSYSVLGRFSLPTSLPRNGL